MKKGFFLLATVWILLFGASITAYAQPKTMEDGTIFDAEYYANTYADVKAAFGMDETALYNHYVQNGKAEGRLAYDPNARISEISNSNDSFDAAYYAKNNPDVVAVLGNVEDVLYQHYINYGKKEGRLPNGIAETSQGAKPKVTAKSSSNSSQVIAPTQNKVSGALVWVPTNGGSKYHKKSSCSNMKNPRQVSIETAQKQGFKACKKCYK